MKWKEYPQNIRVRLITSFFNRMVSMAVMPFMALFFAEELGKVWAGLFLVGTVVISFIVNLIGGYISDRFQRKKVLLVTSSLNALLFLIMTLSLLPEQNGIWLFAAAYTAFIVTSSLGRPAMHAIIIDSTTPENRKAVYAIDYWLINLSMAIGTAIGGLMYVSHKVELFLLLSITSAMLPVAYNIWLKDERTRLLEKRHQNVFYDLLQNYKVAFQDAPFVKVVAGSIFIFAAEFSLNSYIGVRLAESFTPLSFGAFEVGGVRMLSFLNILNMLLVVCLTFWINRFTNRFRKQNVLLIGLAIYGVGYVVITSANTWYVLIAFMAVATIGELIYSPVRNAEQANMMPEDKRGSYSAFSNLSFSGADLVARSTIIIGAYLAPMMMSVYMGVLLMAGTALVYAGLFYKKQPNKKAVLTKAL
ncbi:Na+/melibiose symporter-like transporter [Planomicrobium soli]|uniref:Na+/melibiose symporter-like transporter n=1 Tax=Planomicrobium soli TaxID=1176648 RepID=A0A2P8H6E1_9BACL|nr:MFS transporter [Planomicrobium soli]PSL41769.1 Na+/melibiose symporter-like transporter [Planomicrobium soli]